jgi:L-asparagine transporter-like permease
MIMAEHDEDMSVEAEKQQKKLTGWVRFFAVLYRIVLVAGLLALVAVVVLLLATDLFNAWVLLLPAALITLGIVLARVEYRLDLRLYDLHNQEPEPAKK